ncbi:hypothetical protein JCM31826_00910 [Thermaurantimonas aggregans]|uniref:DUF349 domain-containing protein n=1 Tax=Thermaurantimonas aggregans TaxID=2173829 RepID=A0A401XHX0_9FLAO|nr:DUF349 domain-containing protein [Thermaurantimonas aggregans]MCX8149169.1 DUF349 domain-containing protein [Thermaurantimonas aggregans]GCD76609.1 hypothetical protein JCM31826_00910 [Thermaurantimonas aggregans]
MNNGLHENEVAKTVDDQNEITVTSTPETTSIPQNDELDDIIQEHHSDEDDHEDEASESDSLYSKYADYTPEQLYKEAVSLLKHNHVSAIKQHMEAIKRHLLYHLDEERKDKLHAFIEEGGNEIDFSYEQPLRIKFKELYKEYKDKLNAYYKEKKEQLENNLHQKQLILEELKELAMNVDITEEIFEKVRTLQEKWKKIGPIPYNMAEHINRTYSFYLDRFYDNLKLNKDFRDLHFRKNQEIKEEIIQRALELADKTFERIADFNKAVRALEKEWRETGPVPYENREALAKAFYEAIDKVRSKKSELAELVKKEKEEKISQKKAILEELRSINLDEINTHEGWQNLTQSLSSYTERFKKIGRVLHEENDKIWEEFNAAIREIKKRKNAFYKQFKQIQQQNLQKKKELIELARQNAERTDWEEGVNFFKKLQADWKNIGPVPRKFSESVWNEFREFCNSFFDRYHAYLKEKEAELYKNYENKKAQLEELKTTPSDNISVPFLKEQIEKWKALGKVPTEYRDIEKEFQKLIDALFEKLDLDKENIYLVRFEAKMQALWDADDKQAVYIERQRLLHQYDDLKKDLQKLENNINLFSNKSSSNPFIKEVEKNIARHKANLELVAKKLEILDQFPLHEVKIERTQRSERQKHQGRDRKNKKGKRQNDKKR